MRTSRGRKVDRDKLDLDFREAFFRLRVINRVSRLPLVVVSGEACRDNFLIQDLELLKVEGVLRC